jgi:Type I restriction enzyme R protein N terminus (HSDR_N)
VIEKGLAQMPHLALAPQKLPERRADLVFFAKGIHHLHDLYPLLLVECKAVKLTPKVINQVTSYNHYLQAYFVAVVNQEKVLTGWYDPSERRYRFVEGLPPYSELLRECSCFTP